MKRSRTAFLLLLISFLVPLNVACLYQDYYEDADFLFRKHFAAQEEEGLLITIQKNPWMLIDPDHSFPSYATFLLEFSFPQAYSPSLYNEMKNLELRC